MTFADMTQPDRVAYFNYYGDALTQEWAAVAAAVERWAAVCKRAEAFENRSLTAEKYVADSLDALRNPLAEEVAEYIGP